MKGRLGQGAFSVSKEENSPLRLRAEDGGAAAKFLDFYTHIEGGLLELTLREEVDGSHGAATLRNFTVRNESALQRMSSAAPPPPPRPAAGTSRPMAAAPTPTCASIALAPPSCARAAAST